LFVIDMPMSLDGFVAGLDDGKTHPLGRHGGTHVFGSGSAVRWVARFHRRVHAGR
jgi:hypothetical protein